MAEDEKILIYNAVGLNRRWWQKRWTFFFIDTPDYKGDDMIEKHGIRVKYIGDYDRKDSPYIIVSCKVRDQDIEEFLHAMHDLQRIMLISGHFDYEEFCREWVAKMEAEDDDG